MIIAKLNPLLGRGEKIKYETHPHSSHHHRPGDYLLAGFLQVLLEDEGEVCMPMKNKSVSQLKKIADKWCSQYIRRKYADWKGETACYTCGVKKPWKEIQCGHFVSRVYTATRWYPSNLRPQCYRCNVLMKGMMDEFAAKLERETPGILDELNRLKHTPVSTLKIADLVMVIEEFKGKLKPL